MLAKLQSTIWQPCQSATHFLLRFAYLPAYAATPAGTLVLLEKDFRTAGMEWVKSVVRSFKTIRLINQKPCLPNLNFYQWRKKRLRFSLLKFVVSEPAEVSKGSVNFILLLVSLILNKAFHTYLLETGYFKLGPEIPFNPKSYIES